MAVPGFFERGGAWVIAQSVLMLAVLVAGPVWSGDPGPWSGTVAGVLLLLGGAVGTWGALLLRGNRTIFPRPNAGSSLVQTGVYRWIRHPLYFSVITLSLAWAVFWASWTTATLAGGLSLLLLFKAAREERWLVEHFPDYADYRRRTWRLIPGLY